MNENELRCPNCGEIIEVSKTKYNEMLSQIKTKEFEKEVAKKTKESLKNHQVKNDLEKEREAQKRKEELAKKDKEINELQQKVSEANKEKELALVKSQEQLKEELRQKEKEVENLNYKMKNLKKDNEYKLKDELSQRENSIKELKSQIKMQEKEKEIEKENVKKDFQKRLAFKEDELKEYKEMKLRQSTKIIGESLEQHCEITFNKERMGRFPNAEFGKDSNIETGTKGDYIYREKDESGVEFLSIMFEMKNEGDETKTKKKNEDFLKKLDKDRRDKGCEYAVLVSLLEKENDYYNEGIVDVSYKYPKMYVIRPQFFVPMITLLRNMALNIVSYKREVMDIRTRNEDYTHFETNFDAFKDELSDRFGWAHDRFEDAIDGIDKTIKQLEKTKKDLLTSGKHLKIANNKAIDMTVEELTRDSPLTREKIKLK